MSNKNLSCKNLITVEQDLKGKNFYGKKVTYDILKCVDVIDDYGSICGKRYIRPSHDKIPRTQTP